MATARDPSERVVEQRLRNRAIEALETLAEGNEGVRSVGVGEYVEDFFDVIDDRSPLCSPVGDRRRRSTPG